MLFNVLQKNYKLSWKNASLTEIKNYIWKTFIVNIMCLLISLREYFTRLQPSIIQYSKLEVQKYEKKCVHFRKKHTVLI